MSELFDVILEQELESGERVRLAVLRVQRKGKIILSIDQSSDITDSDTQHAPHTEEGPQAVGTDLSRPSSEASSTPPDGIKRSLLADSELDEDEEKDSTIKLPALKKLVRPEQQSAHKSPTPIASPIDYMFTDQAELGESLESETGLLSTETIIEKADDDFSEADIASGDIIAIDIAPPKVEAIQNAYLPALQSPIEPSSPSGNEPEGETQEVMPYRIVYKGFAEAAFQAASAKPLYTIRYGILLVLLLASAVLLWRDLTETHLYAYALDAAKGVVLKQQDIEGYQSHLALTQSVYTQSAIFAGAYSDTGQESQQLLRLKDNDTTWNDVQQFPAALTHGALSLTAAGNVIAESRSQLQVMTPSGQLLWQRQGTYPWLGAHHFQPASDGKSIFTIQAVKPAQVVAYDQQNGSKHWTRALSDTGDYMPPLLFDGSALYVASDHTIYALDSSDGHLLWQQQRVARTLLMQNDGRTRLLIAAGPQGLVGLDTTTGRPTWTFHSQVNSSITPAQLYQATLASTQSGNVIYTTGIAWLLPQAQEQIWLYAINAASGTLLWSQQVATGFTSADAGRLFTPLVESTQGSVVLQTQPENSIQSVSAYDMTRGRLLWKVNIKGINTTSPALLRASHNTLVLFATSTSSLEALRHPSLSRALTIAILVLSLVSLILMWQKPGGHPLFKRAYTSQISSRKRIALLLLIVLVGAGIAICALLSQPHDTIYQVTSNNGDVQWQHRADQSIQVAGTDAQGSVLEIDLGNNMRQLQVLNRSGENMWQTFASEGIFSLPVPSTRPGTLLVALHGDSPFRYHFSPDDPAYAHQLTHLLALYLFERSTGKLIWQRIVVYPDEKQSADVLGVDKSFIYIVVTQMNAGAGHQSPRLQLLAVNQATGNVDWRIFGPTEQPGATRDDGKLLLTGEQAFWQVAGNIYAVDTTLGQIEWHRTFARTVSSLLPQEASQMTQANGAILLTMNDGVYALDPDNGNQLWQLSARNIQEPLKGIITSAHTILLYNDRHIRAFDTATQQLVWQKTEAYELDNLSFSGDGKLVFAEEHANGKASILIALDTQTGKARWSFTPATGVSLLRVQQNQFNPSLALFLVSFPVNQATCSHERLYALDNATGAVRWMFNGTSITDIGIVADGSTLVLRISKSYWDIPWSF